MCCRVWLINRTVFNSRFKVIFDESDGTLMVGVKAFEVGCLPPLLLGSRLQ